MRISSGPGAGTGSSCTVRTSGPPVRSMATARMVGGSRSGAGVAPSAVRANSARARGAANQRAGMVCIIRGATRAQWHLRGCLAALTAPYAARTQGSRRQRRFAGVDLVEQRLEWRMDAAHRVDHRLRPVEVLALA